MAVLGLRGDPARQLARDDAIYLARSNVKLMFSPILADHPLHDWCYH